MFYSRGWILLTQKRAGCKKPPKSALTGWPEPVLIQVDQFGWRKPRWCISRTSRRSPVPVPPAPSFEAHRTDHTREVDGGHVPWFFTPGQANVASGKQNVQQFNRKMLTLWRWVEICAARRSLKPHMLPTCPPPLHRPLIPQTPKLNLLDERSLGTETVH